MFGILALPLGGAPAALPSGYAYHALRQSLKSEVVRKLTTFIAPVMGITQSYYSLQPTDIIRSIAAESLHRSAHISTLNLHKFSGFRAP